MIKGRKSIRLISAILKSQGKWNMIIFQEHGIYSVWIDFKNRGLKMLKKMTACLYY